MTAVVAASGGIVAPFKRASTRHWDGQFLTALGKRMGPLEGLFSYLASSSVLWFKRRWPRVAGTTGLPADPVFQGLGGAPDLSGRSCHGRPREGICS